MLLFNTSMAGHAAARLLGTADAYRSVTPAAAANDIQLMLLLLGCMLLLYSLHIRHLTPTM
jgi:hypothetical protein